MAMSVVSALVLELDTHTPCFDHKDLNRCYILLQKIITITSSFTDLQQVKVKEALKFSAEKHKGMRRANGSTPYFLHLLEVVYILHQMNIHDYKTLVAAILHDTVEDTTTTLNILARRFGQAIKNIVDLVTKYRNGTKKKNYFYLMRTKPDLNCRWRAVVIKFADRIHNMMTLKNIKDVSRRCKKIKETQEEFPLLYRSLVTTIQRLIVKRTIKNKSYATLAFRLNNRLFVEMSQHL